MLKLTSFSIPHKVSFKYDYGTSEADRNKFYDRLREKQTREEAASFIRDRGKVEEYDASNPPPDVRRQVGYGNWGHRMRVTRGENGELNIESIGC